ncbi:hypothetical protein [Rossellomorea vietnamensis]|uniref:hypothetical protein n=1 Tax=Rossellomorea vietnamensis TaxID=218284 RepID=UPI003D2678BA
MAFKTEWVIYQYQGKVNKKTGIIDDPNEFLINFNLSIKTRELLRELPLLGLDD